MFVNMSGLKLSHANASVDMAQEVLLHLQQTVDKNKVRRERESRLVSRLVSLLVSAWCLLVPDIEI